MPKRELLFPAINVNDSGDQEQVRQRLRLPALADRRHQPRHRRADRRQGRRGLRLRRRRQGLRESLRGQGARVIVTEIDPICALQAAMEGYQVATARSSGRDADIVITATGNTSTWSPLEHMKAMKHQAIVGNIGHFDNEIDMAGLEKRAGRPSGEHQAAGRQWTFDDGKSIIVLSEGRLLNLGNATGHPSFVMSNSFSNQVIAQIELWTKNDEYDNEVYRLPWAPDEKVARIHVEALGGSADR